jgi:hypothetical protein
MPLDASFPSALFVLVGGARAKRLRVGQQCGGGGYVDGTLPWAAHSWALGVRLEYPGLKVSRTGEDV